MSSVNQDGPITNEGLLHAALFVCRGFATSLEVFLHRGLGSRYLGLQAAAVLVLVPLFGCAWEGHDLTALLLFLPAYLVMCLVARGDMLRRRLRGEHCHTQYSGWPRLLKPGARMTELGCKQFCEPLLAFAAGFVVYQLNERPFGGYLMFSAVCLAISTNVDVALDRLRAENMNDAVIEQELLAERFRRMRGER
ncbi:MAG: hypothetical protein JNK76_07335 [Planctomycetales bacterium]|nr:hypothetical protein [Planctomycetales bacterium]MBN8629199.1 hypothetical protein [Planctomycetota bacterium]